MGLFSRRRYAEGTVPDHVEELDASVIGPPPASYQPQPSHPPPQPQPQPASYPSPRHAPHEAAGEVEEEFYDDEDSEDRAEPGERQQPRFLPPPPTRRMPPGTGRGVRLGFFAVAILVALARWIVGALPEGGSDDGSARWKSVRDVYATVASEPERRLSAQGIEFQLLGNQPLDPEVCSFLDSCLAGAAAEWDVTGSPLTGRSWYLVFEDEAAADAAAQNPQLFVALAPGLPPTWAIRAGSPGRFLTIAGVGDEHDAAADVRSDPAAVAAADALRLYSTEPAVLELTNR